MAALRSFAVALALFSATPAAADQVDRWRAYIDDAAARCAVPADWIVRVIRAESAGLTTLDGRPITSRAGAMGLMQLMPATWGEMRATLHLGDDPYQPHDNILAGACYLRQLHDRFGYPGLFAAYNAGPTRYTDYLTTGRPLPGETRSYLATVGGAPSSGGIPPVGRPAEPLFYALSTVQQQSAATPKLNAMFVTLTRDRERQ